jgi:hypothetical protein
MRINDLMEIGYMGAKTRIDPATLDMALDANRWQRELAAHRAKEKAPTKASMAPGRIKVADRSLPVEAVKAWLASRDPRIADEISARWISKFPSNVQADIRRDPRWEPLVRDILTGAGNVMAGLSPTGRKHDPHVRHVKPDPLGASGMARRFNDIVLDHCRHYGVDPRSGIKLAHPT